MSFGYGFGLPSWQPLSGGFSPASLFTGGEAGFWYDPTDIPLAWRRNLLTYTEQLTNAAYTSVRATTAASTAVVPPSGISTLVKITEDSTASNTHLFLSAADTVVTAGSRYTTTIYARAAERSWIQLQEGQGVTAGAYFDLANGTVGTVSGTGSPTAAITSAGSGWYRCQISWTSVGNAARIRVFLATGDGAAVYSGDGTSGVYLTGAQLELGSTASTYQQIVTPEISFLQYQSQPVLYTDSAGTTPVTAVEQAVGLMLDKSKGLVLGSEVVTNGTFDTNLNGWSLSVAPWNPTWAAGRIRLQTDGSVFSRADQTLTVTSGRTYRLSFNVAVASGSLNVKVGTTLGGSELYSSGNLTSTGSRALFFTATASTIYIRLENGSVASPEMDDISVRELPGNHAFQTSSTKRPVLRARYNLLTYSEDISNAAWSVFGTSSKTNSTTVAFPNADSSLLFQNQTSATVAAGQQITGTAILSGSGTIQFGVSRAGGLNPYEETFVTVTLTSTPTRYTVTHTMAANQSGSGMFLRRSATNTATSVVITASDLRPASQATGLIGPTYQRIAAATDYDVVGFLPYLQFDGFDDALTTNSIDFSATDKMTVFAGVRKLSDAAVGVVAETSATAGPSNPGSFVITAPRSAGLGNYRFISVGTALSDAFPLSGYDAPITNVLTGIGDISGDVCTLRINGTQAATSSTDQGTGNYGNYPLFIGARNQTSLYFNGWMSSLIGRGASTTAGQISATEQWIGVRTGVQI